MFLLYVQVEVYQYLFKIEVLAHVKAFLEKKRSGTSLPASFSAWFCKKNVSHVLWCRGVVFITTVKLHLTNPELRFCARSNPASSISEIWGEQMRMSDNGPGWHKVKHLSSVNHTTKAIHHHDHHHHYHHHILLTDQIPLPDCLYFLKCWAIYVLKLFVSKSVTS